MQDAERPLANGQTALVEISVELSHRLWRHKVAEQAARDLFQHLDKSSA